MIPSEAQAAVVKSLVPANDRTGCSGDFTSVLAEGEILIIEDIGDVTGTMAGALWTASSAAGADATSLTFEDDSEFTARTGPNYCTKKILNARKCLGFLGYLGTVTTGPIGISVVAVYRPKTTT